VRFSLYSRNSIEPYFEKEVVYDCIILERFILNCDVKKVDCGGYDE